MTFHLQVLGNLIHSFHSIQIHKFILQYQLRTGSGACRCIRRQPITGRSQAALCPLPPGPSANLPFLNAVSLYFLLSLCLLIHGMPFFARIGVVFNASVGGLFIMMPARTGLRSILSLSVFFVLFVFAFGAFEFLDGPPDGRVAWEFQRLNDEDLREQEANQRPFAVCFYFVI